MSTAIEKARIYRELKAKYEYHRARMERAIAVLEKAERAHIAKAA